jgi:hypothetical protein
MVQQTYYSAAAVKELCVHRSGTETCHYQNLTVYKQVEVSKIPNVVSSGTFRSVTRPRGRFMKGLVFQQSGEITPFNLAERINNNELVVVPPKEDPEGAINLNDIAEDVKPKDIPPAIEESLKKNNSLIILALVAAIIFLLLAIVFLKNPLVAVLCFGFSALSFWFYLRLKKWKKQIEDANTLSPENFTPEAVKDIPISPDFYDFYSG